MSKVTIIGLGLVGSSIGMALKRATAGTQSIEVVGFDPERVREQAALRTHNSVDVIAPDLESAVRGAQLVIIDIPASAMREVLAAIDPFLDEGATVTDTLPTKEQVLSWAGELLNPRVSFVGGHPFSLRVDLAAPAPNERPSADLFLKAPYCIVPLPSAQNEALGQVISLVEMLGARPLFVDQREHDSFVAAVGQLPALASAALLRATVKSPAWSDMSLFAQDAFKTFTGVMPADAGDMRDTLLSNRQSLIRWIDQYLISLQELRDLLAHDDPDALLLPLREAREARQKWLANKDADTTDETLDARRGDSDPVLRSEVRQAIDDARPSRGLMGGYISDRLFRKKDK